MKDDWLIWKNDFSIISRSEFIEKFNKNYNEIPNGWARDFGDLDSCIKAWFF